MLKQRVLLAGMLFGGFHAFAAETLRVPVPLRLEAEGDNPAVAESRPVMVVEVEGGAEPLRLPVLVDTSLLKDGDKPRNQDADIQLRDNRWHQGLFRFDLSPVPKDVRVRSAKLEFTLGWAERKGSAAVSFYPMLTEWSAEATWLKPEPDAAPWKGLVAGKDYAKEPVGTYAVDEVKTNTRVVMEGFGPLVADWISGKKADHGVLAQFSGKAMQVNIRSMDTPVKKTLVHQVKLAAGAETPFRLSLDLDVVRRLVLSEEDLRGAAVSLSVNGKDDLGGLIVTEGGGHPVRIDERRVIVSGFGDELRELLGKGEKEVELKLAMKSSRGIAVTGPDGGKEQRPALLLETVDHGNAELWKNKIAPRAGVYVEHRSGNLYYGGERLRLWGGVGYGSIPRMRRMGFNAWRVWPVGDKAYDAASMVTGGFVESKQGDGSELDRIDRMYAGFKENGFFLMAPQLMGVMPPKLLMRDDSFVAGGDDWEAWKAAVGSIAGSADAGGSAAFRRFAFVDERARKARMRHAVNFLNRVNPYTGKRYAEEEHIAIWELDNELGFVRHLQDGGAAKWPEYFRNELDAKWTEWVRGRYPREEALALAWGGLAKGETYASLKCVPVTAADAGSAARAADFIRFAIGLADGFYQELRELARKQAPAGLGVAVAPFSFDTQYRPGIPWIYQQTRGDVANFGMYFWDTSSQLTRPPAAYVMDSHTVEDKLTVIYETNQARPSPYRTEYPFRLAALASQQDWDAIFFHYWGGQEEENDEDYMARPMKYMTTSHYWDGVHHESDPAMTSAMAIAGRIFLDGDIPPAPAPAIYRVGARGIFSNAFANGLSLRDDTFARGARLRFEPEGDFELIEEDAGPADEGKGIVRNGPVTWDWQEGRLVIDAPAAKVFVGPVPEKGHVFEGGIALSGFSAPWASFALVSADGRPLAETDRAYATAMADAANTGFEFDWTAKGGPTEQAKAIKDNGHAPAKVDRIDYTLGFPQEMDWKVDAYDFAVRRLAEVSGKAPVLRVRADAGGAGEIIANARPQEIWMNVLSFGERRGKTVQVVMDQNTGDGVKKAAAADGVAEATVASLAEVWNPLPGLSWGDNSVLARRKLTGMAAKHGAVTMTSGAIEIADSQAVFDAPARTELVFAGGRMKDISLTFSQPPPLREVVAAYEARFGKPAEKSMTDDQFGQSTVRWVIPGKEGELTILLTDAQAIMKIVYSLAVK